MANMEISRWLRTYCDVIFPFRAGKKGKRGFGTWMVLFEWKCKKRSFAALFTFLLHIGILKHVRPKVSWRDSQKVEGEVCWRFFVVLLVRCGKKCAFWSQDKQQTFPFKCVEAGKRCWSCICFITNLLCVITSLMLISQIFFLTNNYKTQLKIVKRPGFL